MVFHLAASLLLATVGLGSIATSGSETPGDGVAVLDEARRLAAADRREEAVALLEERARHWSEAGRLADAEMALGLAVDLVPDNAALRLQLGRILMLDKRPAAALEHLERAEELGMRSPVLLFHIGSARWETGEIEAAAGALEAAVEASGRSPLTVHQLGRLELWRGRADVAIALLEEAAAAMPEALDVRYDLARALDRSGRTEEAVRWYRLVTDEAPGHIQARYGLALALERLGRHAAAAEEMAVYQRLYRQDQEQIRERGRLEAGLEHARLLLRRGSSEEALRKLEELPETADTLLVRALALRASGRSEAAAEELERAVSLEPRRADLRALLAELRGRDLQP